MFGDAWWIGIAPVAIIGLLALLIFLLIRAGLRYRHALRETAEVLGCNWESGGFMDPGAVVGSVDGEQVDIFPHKQGVGSFERLLTVIEIDLTPPMDAEFRVGRENVLNKLSHTFGVHDHEFDDGPFDDLFLVNGADPEELDAIFNPDARAALVDFAEGSDDIHVTPARIRWEKSGRCMNAELMVRVTQAGVLAAKAMRRGVKRVSRYPMPTGEIS